MGRRPGRRAPDSPGSWSSTSHQVCCVCRAFPVSVINFTPTAEGTRQHGPARPDTDTRSQPLQLNCE
eukprot:7053750-Prymnesium_polylepis.1